jgi:hypothetical protein
MKADHMDQLWFSNEGVYSTERISGGKAIGVYLWGWLLDVLSVNVIKLEVMLYIYICIYIHIYMYIYTHKWLNVKRMLRSSI